MASHGTRFRSPRKVKKAWFAMLAGTATPKQRILQGRCHPIAPLGWSGVRHHNAFVAMGDTSTCRRNEHRNRLTTRFDNSRAGRRVYGL